MNWQIQQHRDRFTVASDGLWSFFESTLDQFAEARLGRPDAIRRSPHGTGTPATMTFF
jgi:hypothetical protein